MVALALALALAPVPVLLRVLRGLIQDWRHSADQLVGWLSGPSKLETFVEHVLTATPTKILNWHSTVPVSPTPQGVKSLVQAETDPYQW